MKQAIEAGRTTSSPGNPSSKRHTPRRPRRLDARRAERDKLFRSVAALKAKGQEREKAVTAAKTAEERQLARARLTNAKLEARVEDLRLKVLEATQGREASLAEVRQLNQSRTHRSRSRASCWTRCNAVIGSWPSRSSAISSEPRPPRRARRSNPTTRSIATGRSRLAELLELEAQIVKNEQSLATSSRPSLEEERALADRAESEFAQIKQLLDDGNVSRLDALRLNNDFRRIGPERDGLLRNELSTIETQIPIF